MVEEKAVITNTKVTYKLKKDGRKEGEGGGR